MLAQRLVGLTHLDWRLSLTQPPTRRTLYWREVSQWLVAFLVWNPWLLTVRTLTTPLVNFSKYSWVWVVLLLLVAGALITSLLIFISGFLHGVSTQPALARQRFSQRLSRHAGYGQRLIATSGLFGGGGGGGGGRRGAGGGGGGSGAGSASSAPSAGLSRGRYEDDGYATGGLAGADSLLGGGGGGGGGGVDGELVKGDDALTLAADAAAAAAGRGDGDDEDGAVTVGVFFGHVSLAQQLNGEDDDYADEDEAGLASSSSSSSSSRRYHLFREGDAPQRVHRTRSVNNEAGDDEEDDEDDEESQSAGWGGGYREEVHEFSFDEDDLGGGTSNGGGA